MAGCLVDRAQILPESLLYLDYASNLFSIARAQPTLSRTLDHPSNQTDSNQNASKPSLLYSLSSEDNFEITSFVAFFQPQKNIEKIVLGTSNGALLFLSSSGEIIKRVEKCHLGSITHLIFSKDGQSLISSSEDGSVKLWSSSGMLRKKIAALQDPITALHWSPDSSLLAVGSPNKITIKHMLKNVQDIEILLDSADIESPGSPCFLSWSPSSRYLLSGSELGTYLLHTASGEALFKSDTFPLPFEHGGWLPSSDSFLVTALNCMILSDIYGKVLFKSSLPSDSQVSCVALSPHGTEAILFQTNGNIASLPLLLQTPLKYKNFLLSTDSQGFINVKNVSTDYSETLDLQVSHISALTCDFGHLAVLILKRLFIYDLENLLTPCIFDFTGASADFLKLSPQSLLIYNHSPPQFHLFSLSGKPLSVFSLSPSLESPFLSPQLTDVSFESLFVSGKPF